MRKLLLIVAVAAAALMSACSGTTLPATNITNDSVQFRVKVDCNAGEQGDQYFRYTTNPSQPRSQWSKTPTVRYNCGQALDDYVHTLAPTTGLSPLTIYYYTFCGTLDGTDGQEHCWDKSGTRNGTNYSSVTTQAYSDTAFINRLVPSSPVLRTKSADVVNWIVNDLTSPKPLIIDEGRGWDYQHPRYHAKSTDPLCTLNGTDSWSQTDGEQIRIPVGAHGAYSSDGHAAIIQPNGWEYDFKDFTECVNGTATFGAGGKVRTDGSGVSDLAGYTGNATVANFALLAGPIRADELMDGNINHALFATISCSDATNVPPALTSGFGAPCATGDRWKAPPLGARFYFAASDAYIDGLSIPYWRKAIVRAAAHYGIYFGDTGGNGFKFQLESSETYRSFGLPDPLVAWAAENGVPTNSGGRYFLDLKTGVDWSGRLRMIQYP